MAMTSAMEGGGGDDADAKTLLSSDREMWCWCEGRKPNDPHWVLY